ncbi:MAG: apolipoprotein N-acyltransferase [Vulcanimicrobiaceae bacterium]
MVSSLAPLGVALLGALALALAFPKFNASALAPIGLIGLFWAWFESSPKRAFWIGWLAGTVFFAITFAWFGETAGALIAPFGFVLALGPALGDGFFGFALVGALVATIARGLRSPQRAVRALAPLAAAAAFALGEWLRSQGLGPISVPFGELAYTQAASPLGPIAALCGPFGLTFALAVFGAYVAAALRPERRRGTLVDASAGVLGVLALTAIAWATWAAPHAARATMRVAAIQGNVAQSLKWSPDALGPSLERYALLTRIAARGRPKLIVWPETVVPTVLNEQPRVERRLGALARSVHAELVAGSLLVAGGKSYNVLAFFTPDGGLDALYRKRRLVPFAERLPFKPLFAWIPWTRNVSDFSPGDSNGIVPVGPFAIGPTICWESAFSNLFVGDVQDGATAFLISTDDAWFGTSAGPYQHAQIAQLRAIETGRWIVRAASTGISGVIAPTGRYRARSALDQEAVVLGSIGPPVETLYDRLGGPAIVLLLAALCAGYLGWLAVLRARA